MVQLAMDQSPPDSETYEVDWSDVGEVVDEPDDAAPPPANEDAAAQPPCAPERAQGCDEKHHGKVPIRTQSANLALSDAKLGLAVCRHVNCNATIRARCTLRGGGLDLGLRVECSVRCSETGVPSLEKGVLSLSQGHALRGCTCRAQDTATNSRVLPRQGLEWARTCPCHPIPAWGYSPGASQRERW